MWYNSLRNGLIGHVITANVPIIDQSTDITLNSILKCISRLCIKI